MERLKTNREITITYVNHYLSLGNKAKAESILKGHLTVDVDDYEASHLLGLLTWEGGQKELANPYFKAACKQIYLNPKHFLEPELERMTGAYLYHYAQSLQAIGNTEKSKTALKLAKYSRYVSEAASVGLKNLDAGVPLSPLEFSEPGLFNMLASFGVGYDSNVLLLSEDTLAVSAQSQTESLSSLMSASLTYLKPMWDGLFSANFSPSFQYYASTNAQTFNTLSTHVEASWSTPPPQDSGWKHEWVSQFDLTFLNSDGLEFYQWIKTLGYEGQNHYWNGDDLKVAVLPRYQKTTFDETSDPDIERTGLGAKLSADYSKVFSWVSATGGLYYDRSQVKGKGYRTHQLGTVIEGTRSLPYQLSGNVSFDFSKVWYLEADDLRIDTPMKANLSVSRMVTKKIQGTFEYQWKKNFSNTVDAQYAKHTITLTGTYEF